MIKEFCNQFLFYCWILQQRKRNRKPIPFTMLFLKFILRYSSRPTTYKKFVNEDVIDSSF